MPHIKKFETPSSYEREAHSRIFLLYAKWYWYNKQVEPEEQTHNFNVFNGDTHIQRRHNKEIIALLCRTLTDPTWLMCWVPVHVKLHVSLQHNSWKGLSSALQPAGYSMLINASWSTAPLTDAFCLATVLSTMAAG